MTVYGNGSQTRGLINIVDTVECIRLAAEQPADRGEFRVFNQLTETLSIREIADTVASNFPGECRIEHVENPRVEAEDHYYNVTHQALVDLGLEPHYLSETLIESMFGIVERYQDRVDRDALVPLVNWRRATNPVRPPSALRAGDLGSEVSVGPAASR